MYILNMVVYYRYPCMVVYYRYPCQCLMYYIHIIYGKYGIQINIYMPPIFTKRKYIKLCYHY